MATIFVGTYTEPLDHVDGRGQGIYVYSFDQVEFDRLSITEGLANPSFIHVDMAANRLYAVSEVMQHEGRAQGAAQSFAIDPVSKQLTPLNDLPIPGQAPCYISLKMGYALIANYMGGSVTVVRLNPDGSLGEITDHVQHSGSGPNTSRQEAPHPHAIVPEPVGNGVLVSDLGTDLVTRYALDKKTGTLSVLGSPTAVHPGAGPRHLAISPDGHHVYLMNELDSTITVFALEADGLRAVQTVSALPDTFDGVPSGADIHVHPSGRFVYASLRGPEKIVHLLVDPATGQLSRPKWTSTCGQTPRNFAMDPAGESLIVANQDSGWLSFYYIHPRSGILMGPAFMVILPSPACVVICD